MTETPQQCPPCNNECRQGRDCPQRRGDEQDFDDEPDSILVIEAGVAVIGAAACLAYVLWL